MKLTIEFTELSAERLLHPEIYDDQGRMIGYESEEVMERWRAEAAGKIVIRAIAICGEDPMTAKRFAVESAMLPEDKRAIGIEQTGMAIARSFAKNYQLMSAPVLASA